MFTTNINLKNKIQLATISGQLYIMSDAIDIETVNDEDLEDIIS